MTTRQVFWNAFKNFAIIFSFTINLILIIALLTVSLPGLRLALGLKDRVVEPLLTDLDSAFLGLGKATIDTSVKIDEPIPIQFNLPLDQQMPIEFNLPLDQSLPINFQLAIDQDTTVVLRQTVPLNGLPATFNFPGGGGAINGSVSLSLPAGLVVAHPPEYERAGEQDDPCAHERAGQRKYPGPSERPGQGDDPDQDDRAGAHRVGRGRLESRSRAVARGL